MSIGSSHMTSPAAICEGFVTASLLKSYGHQIKSLFYNTTFPACYVLHKLIIHWQHALIYVKFSSSFHCIYICLGISFGKSLKLMSNTTLSSRSPTAALTLILYKWPPRVKSDVSEKTLFALLRFLFNCGKTATPNL